MQNFEKDVENNSDLFLEITQKLAEKFSEAIKAEQARKSQWFVGKDTLSSRALLTLLELQS